MAELTDVDSKESITETIKAKLLMGGLRNMFSQLHDAIAEVETDGSVTQRLVEDLMDAQEAIDMVLGQLQVVQDMFPAQTCCEHAECDGHAQCERKTPSCHLCEGSGCDGNCAQCADEEPAAQPVDDSPYKKMATTSQIPDSVLKQIRKPSKKAKAAKPSEPSGNAGPMGLKSIDRGWRSAEHGDFSPTIRSGSTSKVFGRI
jgi:hypothetical protein